MAVVDLLFEHRTKEFDNRRLARQISLTRDQLLITGLTTVEDLLERSKAGIVLWTSGEANRRLHLLYSWESLGVRVFCSKSSGTGKVDVLDAAITAAAQHREFVDPVLSAYLPAAHGPTLAGTILKEGPHRAIWRAVALGAHSRDEISYITGYGSRTIGNQIPEMLDRLLELDPGIRPGKPLSEIVRYANRNWEFFLDDAARRRFP